MIKYSIPEIMNFLDKRHILCFSLNFMISRKEGACDLATNENHNSRR
jgi:hypothetical protein